MAAIKRTAIPVEESAHTVRKVVEVTDYPIETVNGRKLIRRVEKILMPNGHFRFPETYIDVTPGYWIAPKDWAQDRVRGYEMEIAI